MKKQILFSIAALLIVFASRATIKTVRLIAGTDITLNRSETHNVSNGRISGFRLPFISGLPHQVIFHGDFLDLCDRVEIYWGDATAPRRTLTGDELRKTKVNGTGNLTISLRSNDLPSIEGTFIIRIRYAIELTGFDRLDCKVINRGVINSIEWIGTTLPLRQSSSPETETSTLRTNTSYTLRFTGTGLGNSVQYFFSGDRLFNDISNPWSISSVTIPSSTQILMTFTTPNILFNDKTLTLTTLNFGASIPFASDGVGNGIIWGPYIYHRYAADLSTTNNFTNLKVLSSKNPDIAPDNIIWPDTLRFSNVTVSALGRTFKQISPISHLIVTLQPLIAAAAVSGPGTSHSEVDLGTDATLGTITLHEVILPGLVVNVKNRGGVSTSVPPNPTSFIVLVAGNRLTLQSETVSATPTLMTEFGSLNNPTTSTYTIGGLQPGQIFSKNFNHKKFQVLTFSNRPGEFFVDYLLHAESKILVKTDVGDNITETNETNNSKTF